MKHLITISGRDYVSRKIVTDQFGIDTKILIAWTERGILPAPIQLGYRVFYDRENLEAHILSNCRIEHE
jgi:hypothetical protein